MTEKNVYRLREFLRDAFRILRRPGGPEALRRHLEMIEHDTRPVQPPKYCVECGSTDFEPTSTTKEGERVRVLKLRCRACGHNNSF